nr:C1 [Bindweed mottle virus]
MASNTASSSRAFRLQAKNVFITYAQCPLPKQRIMDFLSLFFNSLNILYICVAEELHQDGNPHLHSIIQLGSKCDIKNCRILDITENDIVYHPSIEAMHSPASARKYIQKDGNFIEAGAFSSRRRSPAKDPQAEWRLILEQANDENTFFALVRERKPQDFVLRWPAISTFARDHYRRQSAPYTPQLTNFAGLPSAVQQWASNNILCVSRDFIHYSISDQVIVNNILTEHDFDLYKHYLDWADSSSFTRSPSTSPSGPLHSS